MHLLILNRLFYLLTGSEYNNYTPENILSHCDRLQSIVRCSIGHESKGFVSISALKKSAL